MAHQVQTVRSVLAQLTEPKLKWSIEALNLIKDIRIEQDKLFLQIDLVTDDKILINQFRNDVFQLLNNFQFSEVDLKIEKVHIAKQGLEGVKNIILVGSGKGGVGKSTVATNLAAMLKLRGHSVGLLDADIYGPSIPILMGTDEKPQVLDDEYLNPVEAHGIQTISIGSLVPPDKAISWRGQLVSGTILQFIRKVNWGFLDYLIIDMPPGTGEVQLTVAHELKVKGVIVVSMPQQVVIGDVRRNLTLYQEKNIPILGVIQNMVAYQCESCGHVQTIFPGTKEQLAEVKQIGSLTLRPDLCDAGNQGTPYVFNNRENEIFEEFEKIAVGLEELPE